ncbi:hypothetical protein [Thalassovita taeanensis]|uniref:Uncharacterized protein n=1 Tax=Thalassovita taeanensis TaxID=657014 RepID=A0A1H9C4E6_9RHOB|nr:hypothetical protein [Thalassovita taeanensis]SEP96029.1 hypothetical protein SAMN04488092_103119 [Thalassovita taeanensis]
MKNDLTETHLAACADKLADLYTKEFGGKSDGRYRIPVKLLRQLLQRRRLYDSDTLILSRALFERGFVLIDMETFFVVLSANTFVNYRRVSEDVLK